MAAGDAILLIDFWDNGPQKDAGAHGKPEETVVEMKILDYFTHRLTNAFAEVINSLIQTGKRKDRGFRNFMEYRTMIFLAVGKLQIFAIARFCDSFSRS